MDACDLSEIGRDELNFSCHYLYNALTCARSLIPAESVIMSNDSEPWITPKLKVLLRKRRNAYAAGDVAMYNVAKTNVQKELVTAKESWCLL